MSDELSAREQALRKLPLPYSLALRLRDAGVASDVICEYLVIDEAFLEGFYRVAEAKLAAAQTSKNLVGAGAARGDENRRVRSGGVVWPWLCVAVDKNDAGAFTFGCLPNPFLSANISVLVYVRGATP